MRPVLIVSHEQDRDSGLVAQELERAGCPWVEANPRDGLPRWSIDELSAIVSLGGMASATQSDADPFLGAEVALLRDALASETPVLGLCLGSQLLAVASGGVVSPLGHTCLAWPQFSPLSAAKDDRLFYDLPAGLPLLEWHEDMFTVGPNAVVLGTTPGRGDALYRVGPAAWGSQPHIEATAAMLIDSWLIGDRAQDEVREAGYGIDDFRAECRERVAAQAAGVRPAFARFATLVSERERSHAGTRAAC